MNELVHRLSRVQHLRRDLTAADGQGSIEQADLNEQRRLIPVQVLVHDLVAVEPDDRDERNLHRFPVAGTPGRSQSMRIEWVNRMMSSSTTWLCPIVRETGTISMSDGNWGRKWFA